MLISSSKFIDSMMYSVMFLVPNVYESIIRWPSITVDLCIFNFHFSSDNWYKSFSFYIRNYLGIYFSISFKKTKYYCFHSCSSSSLSSHSCRSEVTFIYLNSSRPYFTFFLFLILEYTLTNIEIPIIYCF